MKSILKSVSIILLFFCAVAAQGFGGKGFVSGTFWAADLDRNEQLSRDEARVVYNLSEEDVFSKYDKNANGSINFIEFAEFMQQSPWTDKTIVDG